MSVRVWGIAVACVLGAVTPVPAVAQAAPPPGPASRASTHLYAGMWTTHLRDRTVRLDQNWLVAVAHGPVFAGTFVNSFNRRAYTFGYQRVLVERGGPRASASFGFRLGGITGYDERFMKFARRTPVVPMVQAFGLFELDHAGIEFSYTMVVVSTAIAFRF